jgi:hypothetical protein
MADEREQQLKRFGEAVEQKNEEAKQASEATQRDNPPSGGGEIAGDEQSLYEAGRPQDVTDARAKNEGKGKKTADKWNQ